MSVLRKKSNSQSDKAIATQYLEEVAAGLGFDSYRDYIKFFRKKAGASSEAEYQTMLAKKRGLDSSTEYQKQLALVRAQNPEYQRLSRLITQRLSELGMTQSELARKSGINRRMICTYAKGTNYPKPPSLRKILQALGIFHYQPLKGDSHLFGKNIQLQKPRNQKFEELSNSINFYFKKYGKDRFWLARETGIHLNHISLYVKGLTYPRPERLRKIIGVLRELDDKMANTKGAN